MLIFRSNGALKWNLYAFLASLPRQRSSDIIIVILPIFNFLTSSIFVIMVWVVFFATLRLKPPNARLIMRILSGWVVQSYILREAIVRIRGSRKNTKDPSLREMYISTVVTYIVTINPSHAPRIV